MRPRGWLTEAAAARPAAIALQTPAEQLTYAELAARALAAASGLAARGVRPGELVAIECEPGVEFAVALHGAWLAGAVAMPIDPRLAAPERAVRLAGSPPQAGAAGAVALRMFSSGTSAAPKPVDLTFANLKASAHGSAAVLGLDQEERWLCPLPLAHIGGLSVLIRSAIHATTAVVHPSFDAHAVAAALHDERITLVSLVPTMLARLLDAGLERPPALRAALLGGAAAPRALLERAAAAGIPVAQTYGLTEAASQVATSRPGELDTVGEPLLGTDVAIAPDGEILIAGPTVAPGALGPDGWLHTGDLGALDARGRLTVTGRTADTIVNGGENVAPAEVEAALLSHPAVADVAVHGVPDPEWGEALVATVVPRDGMAPAPGELRAHVAARLARFKVPKDIRFQASLPRSESGKLLRREL